MLKKNLQKISENFSSSVYETLYQDGFKAIMLSDGNYVKEFDLQMA